MIKIEVASPVLMPDVDLRSGDFVFISIDNRPDRGVPARPPAGENAVSSHRAVRLPIDATEKRCDAALHGCHPADSFRVARREAIPYSPDVLPTFPAFAVKERILQI